MISKNMLHATADGDVPPAISLRWAARRTSEGRRLAVDFSEAREDCLHSPSG